MMEQTLLVIKPDGVQRSIVGEIITRFENMGLKIVAVRMVQVTKEFSRKHYSAHVNKPFYKGLEEFITEGPVIAIVLEGLHAVETVRKLVGPTEPRKAPPGTIRGDYSHHSYEYTDAKGIAIKNLVHASGSLKEAKEEIILWFSPKEIHKYRRADEGHVF